MTKYALTSSLCAICLIAGAAPARAQSLHTGALDTNRVAPRVTATDISGLDRARPEGARAGGGGGRASGGAGLAGVYVIAGREAERAGLDNVAELDRLARLERRYRERLAASGAAPAAPPDRLPVIRRRGAAAVSPKSLAELEDRVDAADEIAALGYRADWRFFTHVQLVNLQLLVRKARAVEALGVDLDWSGLSYAELAEVECRVRAAGELSKLGVAIDWRQSTCMEIGETRGRVEAAASLRALGKEVDWRRHTLAELREMEAKLRSKPRR